MKLPPNFTVPRLSAPTSGSLRRRVRERQLAERNRLEGERLARERNEVRRREKFESQKQAHRELATYEPWGRAGGGAPNPRGIRFSDIRAEGIYPEDELRGVQLHDGLQYWDSSPLRRRKIRQTPLRIREDPQCYYAENLRQSVDNDIRYRQTPGQQRQYKEILDDLVKKRQKALHEEMRRNLEYEQKMHQMETPWGKPGPGGATWRNPRDIGLNFSKSMGWTDNEILDKMSGDRRRPDRSSLTLPQVKRDDDSYQAYLRERDIVHFADKLPDIDRSNSGILHRRDKDITETSREKGETSEHSKEKRDMTEQSRENRDIPEHTKENRDINEHIRENREIVEHSRENRYVNEHRRENRDITEYRGGIGKPVSVSKGKGKRSPKKSKFIKRLPKRDDIRMVYPEDLYEKLPKPHETNDFLNRAEKKPTPEESILHMTGGIELVPLLARRRRVGARTLPSSDVTRPPEQSCQWREMIDAEYLSILKHQINAKCQQKEESRQNSAESVRRHHETWASLWGRPGHGAPQQRGRYARSNLAHLLYVSPLAHHRKADYL